MITATEGFLCELQTLQVEMSAPWSKFVMRTQETCSPSCEELDKNMNMLVVLRDNLIEFVAHESENGFALSLRHRWTLQSGFKCANDK